MAVKVAEERSRERSRGSRKKASFCLSHTDASIHKLKHICVDVLHVQCARAHTHTHLLWVITFIPKKEGRKL